MEEKRDYKSSEKNCVMQEDRESSISDAPRCGKKRSRLVPVLLGTVLAVIAGVYAAGCLYFSKHYQANTFLDGKDVSYMTPTEASKEIKKACSQKRIHIRSGENTYILFGHDIGLSFRDPARAAEKVFVDQPEPYKWPASFISERRIELKGRYSLDAGRFVKRLYGMPFMRRENMKSPENAYISKASDGKGFIIIKETRGSMINRFAVCHDAAEKIMAGRFNIDTSEAPHALVLPDILSSSPELASSLKTLNNAVTGRIIYKIHDGEDIVLGPETLTEWVAKSDEGRYYLDEDKWYENAVRFVDSIAYECNTVWEEREFDSTEDGTVTVAGGTYGYIVDKDEEIDAIMSLMYDGPVNEEREPYYSQKESGDSANHGIGSTYIEVSIDSQHMWYYEDGELIMDSPVVTGTRGYRDTPRGQFFIQFTQRDAVLVGRRDASGQPSYRTPVSWWMPFYDGCGLHDASWRGSFGGSVYTYNGSHGCVNMPPSSALELFEHVEPGIPVIVY